VRLGIDGKQFTADLLGPKSLLPGRAGRLRLRLPPPARKAIAATEAKATVGVSASSGDQHLVRNVTVTLRGRNAD
jgi:hypothetical protein